MTFRLVSTSAGANPLYWDSLQDVLGEADIPIVPDVSYLPYQEAIELANGQKRGMALPSAVWVLTVTGTQKYILRQICPGASVNVYVETLKNTYDINGDRETFLRSLIPYVISHLPYEAFAVGTVICGCTNSTVTDSAQPTAKIKSPELGGAVWSSFPASRETTGIRKRHWSAD